jgi:hypothetical protein
MIRNDVRVEVSHANNRISWVTLIVLWQELFFHDGQLPSQEVIDKWLGLVDEFFDGPYSTKDLDENAKRQPEEKEESKMSASQVKKLAKRKQ